MRVDADGKPTVGSRGNCLGVRPPGNPHADVEVDSAGKVLLNRMRMSVNDDWRGLPGYLIPEQLADDFNGASGRGMEVFVRGNFEFSEGPVAERLHLWMKKRREDGGVVWPGVFAHLDQFQADLRATRENWSVDPETIL